MLCLTDCMHAQVYRGVLNKRKAVAIKTFAHMASEAEVIRFNAVSLLSLCPFSANLKGRQDTIVRSHALHLTA